MFPGASTMVGRPFLIDKMFPLGENIRAQAKLI